MHDAARSHAPGRVIRSRRVRCDVSEDMRPPLPDRRGEPPPSPDLLRPPRSPHRFAVHADRIDGPLLPERGPVTAAPPGLHSPHEIGHAATVGRSECSTSLLHRPWRFPQRTVPHRRRRRPFRRPCATTSGSPAYGHHLQRDTRSPIHALVHARSGHESSRLRIPAMREPARDFARTGSLRTTGTSAWSIRAHGARLTTPSGTPPPRIVYGGSSFPDRAFGTTFSS